MNFTDGDLDLVARDDFHAGEKLCLRWHCPRRILRPVMDYFYLVEDLRNRQLREEDDTRLKFYNNASLDAKKIMSHVLTSETVMQVQRLLRLIDTTDGIYVTILWKGLAVSRDTREPLAQNYQDVPLLRSKLHDRNSAPNLLASKGRRELGLRERGI